jgi:hypothetical protein
MLAKQIDAGNFIENRLKKGKFDVKGWGKVILAP